MRYWYDCEFIEDGKTIDLISIGIVAEDGREYYGQSADFNPAKANEWVKEHVLPNLRQCTACEALPLHRFTGACAWRPSNLIKLEIITFLNIEKYGKPELWGYYSAYDHVAFCQLFGTMMDLPKGYPMYTRDIKQWCDALGNPQLPEQGKGEHNALADARWNKFVYDFLVGYSLPIRKRER